MELLERASFLQALDEHAGEARQGEGRLVLVAGESGMGKTALLDAFQRRTEGTRWLWGACDGLLEIASRVNLFAKAERYYAEGIAYCEEHELGVYSVCLGGWQARTLLLLGRWDEAADIGAALVSRSGISPVNRLNPLTVLGTIRGRRGQDGAWRTAAAREAVRLGIEGPA